MQAIASLRRAREERIAAAFCRATRLSNLRPARPLQVQMIQMMRAKATILDAVLNTSGDLHRLAGGRATSNKYRLDRFWRNARTLSVHDGVDTKLQQIGKYELTGEAPPISGLT